MNALHPKKLLGSKWTAQAPVHREKHFLVTAVHHPQPPESRVEWVDLEAVLTRRVQRIDWRDLRDESQWKAGWR